MDMDNVYFSSSLAKEIADAVQQAQKFKEEGNKELSIYWFMRTAMLLNAGCLEAMDAEKLNNDEALVYSDLSDDMGKHDLKSGFTRTLELHLIYGSPLYKDIVQLLKKHLNDGQTNPLQG